MLPAAARVRLGSDFAVILRRGRRAKRGAVVVHLAERDTHLSGARAGFIVSRAVGTAVARNKVKRRLRHAVARQIPQWPDNLDVVVRALPSAAGTSFGKLATDVEAAVSAGRRRR